MIAPGSSHLPIQFTLIIISIFTHFEHMGNDSYFAVYNYTILFYTQTLVHYIWDSILGLEHLIFLEGISELTMEY